MNTVPTASERALTSCPGCQSESLGASFHLAQQPVILNYRFATQADAQNVARRDMHLRECTQCGLVFNAILDAAAIPYDERYENRQNFSAGFQGLLDQTAETLTHRYLTKASPTVLEVGCGKADFLKQLCARANATGLGYDTSCETSGLQEDGRVTCFQSYVTAADVKEELDLVVCRHVVEHVPEIGEFFRLLHGIAVAGGGAAVYVETPALEWITEHQAFWDVFYEHCNYFPTRTLRHLAEQAGFTVLDHRLIFGDQYQALELRPGAPDPSRPPLHQGEDLLLATFAISFAQSLREVSAKLTSAGASQGWALWGAGAKGVSLANAMSDNPPAFVIDSNPAKQGMFLPGTGISIVSPADVCVSNVAVILVANPNYLPEIRATLTEHGHSPELLSL